MEVISIKEKIRTDAVAVFKQKEQNGGKFADIIEVMFKFKPEYYRSRVLTECVDMFLGDLARRNK